MPLYKQSLDDFYGRLLGLDQLPLPSALYSILLPKLLGVFRAYSFTLAITSEPKRCQKSGVQPAPGPLDGPHGEDPHAPREGAAGEKTTLEKTSPPLCYALIDSQPKSPHLPDPIKLKLKASGSVTGYVDLSFDLDVETKFAVSCIDKLKECGTTCENSHWLVSVEVTCSGTVAASGSIDPKLLSGNTIFGGVFGITKDDLTLGGKFNATVPVWHQETYNYDCTPSQISLSNGAAGAAGAVGGGGGVSGPIGPAPFPHSIAAPKPFAFGRQDCMVKVRVSSITTRSPSLFDTKVSFAFDVDGNSASVIFGMFNTGGVFQPDNPDDYLLLDTSYRSACGEAVNLPVSVFAVIGSDDPLFPPTYGGGGPIVAGPQTCTDNVGTASYRLTVRSGAMREMDVTFAVGMVCG